MTIDSAPQFPTEMSEVDVMLASLHELMPDDPNADDAEGSAAEGEGESTSGVPEGTGDEGGTGDSATVPALAPPGTIEFEGKFWPVEELRQLLSFSERLKTEPDFASRVRQAAVAPTAPAALPAHVDPDDAFQVATWNELQAAKAETARIQAESRSNAERDQRARVVDSFRSAVGLFKSRYPTLSDEQVRNIADATGRANIIEGLERTEGSLTAAFDRGMEMTMWGTPELRSLAQAANTDNVSRKNSTDRKAKQSALSGSGGSAPRTRQSDGPAKNRDELMSRMLADVRADPNLSGS